MSQPQLSIVIASQNAVHTIEKCLKSIEQQLLPNVEVVVADYSTDGTTAIIQKKFPNIQLKIFTSPKLIPELWGEGILQSSGEIIAFTTAHCIPDGMWVSEMIKAHQAPYAAIGGAIELSETAPIVDWAIYFCRYTPFMKPLPKGFVKEVPGDNASYKKYALDECKELCKNGFWETVINAKLRQKGEQLFSSPNIIVYHQQSFSLFGFSKQRFLHGIHFGITRSAELSFIKKIIYIILSPLIPFIFFSHIAKMILKKKTNIKKFILSAPILFIFLISWAMGEWWGYVLGLCKNQKK